MNSTDKKQTWILFLLTLLPALTFPILFPRLHLTFFAPFLVFLYYRTPKISCLWAAFWCGFIMDLLSAQVHMGVHALNYCLTTWILYERRRMFFEDSFISVPIMTALFAMITTIIQMMLMKFFGDAAPAVSPSWVFVDVLLMSVVDAIYALVCFSVPLFIFRKPLQWKWWRRSSRDSKTASISNRPR